MRKQKQLLRHDPGNGVYGDCFRTAIACLLDLEPEDVPHFCDGADTDETAMRDADKWLGERGLQFFSVPYQCDLDDVLGVMSRINAGIYYLLMGESETGVNHNVICLGDQIVWDPSLSDAGIVGPADDGLYWVYVLTPRLEDAV